jgi:hypothetical protein
MSFMINFLGNHGELYTFLIPVDQGMFLSIHSHCRYTRSLNYNRRKDTSCDFHKIKSMEGVYIANVVGNLHSPDCAQCQGSDCREKCSFVSKITIDKGAIWSNIIPPKTDSLGNKLCENKDPDVKISRYANQTIRNVLYIFMDLQVVTDNLFSVTVLQLD